jgi:hypothetical protein
VSFFKGMIYVKYSSRLWALTLVSTECYKCSIFCGVITVASSKSGIDCENGRCFDSHVVVRIR